MNIPEEFAYEYDLDHLQPVTPPGQAFSMLVTPRYKAAYEHGYERFTADLARSILRRAALFVDIGAHYGFYSLLAASQNPDLEVISIEPVPATCAVLARNARRAGTPNIRVLQCAVSEAVGRGSFNVSLASANCSFYEHPNAATLRAIEVETTSVDVLLESKAPCPLVIKIDTEGHELSVLKGMRRTLERFPDIRLIVEFNPGTLRAANLRPEDLLEQLDDLGFGMHFLDEGTRHFYRVAPRPGWQSPLEAGYANVYCIPRERALSVCFFSHSGNLGGAERVLLELVDDLVAHHGAVCAVVVPESGPLAAALERVGAMCIVADYDWWCTSDASLPAQHVRNQSIGTSVKSILREVLPAVRELDPDVIWTQTMVIPWGAMIAAQIGKPHVWYVTEFGERDHGLKFFSPFSAVVREIIESSDQVFTCSRSVADTVFPGARVQVLYCHIQPPPDPAESTPGEYFKMPGAAKLGIFSQIAPAKGTEDIVRAVAQLTLRGRNVELLVAGPALPDYERRLVEIIHAHGMEERVRFAGFLSDPFPAMRAIDIAVICSRAEAFGRVGVEAMLLGKPVVYAAAGGITEYMVEGKTGLSYTPGDVGGLVDRLESLISEPSRWTEIGNLGRARALELFSRDGFSGEVYRTLQRLRREGRKAAGMPKSVGAFIAGATGASPAISRNDPCPCGSGKRYKHCHGSLE